MHAIHEGVTHGQKTRESWIGNEQFIITFNATKSCFHQSTTIANGRNKQRTPRQTATTTSNYHDKQLPRQAALDQTAAPTHLLSCSRLSPDLLDLQLHAMHLLARLLELLLQRILLAAHLAVCRSQLL